jgi:hypothetical protein
MPYENVSEDGMGFMPMLVDAKKEGRSVEVRYTGSYKGILGLVNDVSMGYVEIQQSDRLTKIKLGDIKSVSVLGVRRKSGATKADR